MIKKLLATVAVAGSFTGLSAGIASASTPHSSNTWLSHGDWVCSLTNPSYVLSDNNMQVHRTIGTTSFSASYQNVKGKWEDAYWVTGYNRGTDTSTCNGYGKGKSLTPQYVNNSTVTANFSAHGSGRLGFDLWFVANPNEKTSTQMQHDSRTYEVMVQPGSGIRKDNPGWHRAYVGAGGNASNVTWWGLNLTNLARKAGVPGWYKWQVIGAGGETPSGSFAVSNYYLNISTPHAAPKPKPKPASTWAWTTPVKGQYATTAETKLHRSGFSHVHVYWPKKTPRGWRDKVTGQTRTWMPKSGTVYVWTKAVRR